MPGGFVGGKGTRKSPYCRRKASMWKGRDDIRSAYAYAMARFLESAMHFVSMVSVCSLAYPNLVSVRLTHIDIVAR